MEPEQTTADKAKKRGARALWIGVVLMFFIVIAAWGVLIKVAKENPVEQIEIKSN